MKTFMAVFLAILAAVAMVGGGYLIYQHRAEQQAEARELGDLQARGNANDIIEYSVAIVDGDRSAVTVDKLIAAIAAAAVHRADPLPSQVDAAYDTARRYYDEARAQVPRLPSFPE